MSDTIRQMHNANRVRRALQRCELFIYTCGGWQPCGPLEYFVNLQARRAGGNCALCRINRHRRKARQH